MSALRQLVAYGFVGGVQYAVDVATFTLLWHLTGSTLGSNLVSRLAGAACGFALNARVTFQVPRHARRRLLSRFAVAWVIMTTLSTGALTQLDDLAAGRAESGDGPVALWMLLAQAGTEALLFLVSFTLCKLWVFRVAEAD